MGMTDPIADMLTRLRNAARAGHETVDIPASKLKIEIARVLKEQGYIRDYKLANEDRPDRVLRISLKYGPDRRPAITGVRRISTPGRRVYAGKARLPRVMGGLGIAIVTTPRGVMTEKDARRSGVGGEVLCTVW
ncbi:30S ribosomal protein S8 [Carboxydochorda subterranea]|uniref:Small ribosomal subunit protein uS8 n=1 Tax=Carboxydichorda subterranea TaxID=3109565 RepID=A0ABZ1C093_9FIRM|nr:30S ribosomal protein S8 [Limnochorda sp. L945t]WRP17728.1 30S ribosomal protein S8 [Limnochorda sp. L945t]